jgi:hypothetical protein
MKPPLLQMNLIRIPMLMMSIILTLLSPALASAKAEDGAEVKVLTVNDPLQIRSAKLWMRNGTKEERCSSSIIAKNILLTAAHCVVDWRPENIQVRLSSKAGEAWSEGIELGVRDIIFPPGVDLDIIRKLMHGISHTTLDISDYALVILDSEVPRPFIPVKISQTRNPVVARLTLTGFGTSTNPQRNGYFHKFAAGAFAPEGLGTEVFLRTVMCSGDSGGGVFEILRGGSIALAAVNSRGWYCGPSTATWLPAKAAGWIRSALESSLKSPE